MIFAVLSVYPLIIHLILYGIGRCIFRHTLKHKIVTGCIMLNAVICFATAFWLTVTDDSDMLTGFAGLICGIAWAIFLGIMGPPNLFPAVNIIKIQQISS